MSHAVGYSRRLNQRGEQYFTSSQGTIAYTDSKNGHPSLIFVHGLPTAKELWAPVVVYLPEDWRIVTYDLLDYGQSQKIERHISHQERAAVLDELRAHLGFERFILVAHDLGSSVAIDYMGQYAQHVEKLVLISPPVYPDFTEPTIVKVTRTKGLGEALIGIIKTPLLKIGLQKGITHKERLTPEIFSAFAQGFSGAEGDAALLRDLRWGRPFEVFKEYPRIARSIRVPTLAIQGRQDPYIPADQVERLKADIPDCQVVFIEDGSHFLPIDTPQEVAQAIQSFVQ